MVDRCETKSPTIDPTLIQARNAWPVQGEALDGLNRCSKISCARGERAVSSSKTFDFVIDGGGRQAAAERGAPLAGIAPAGWMRSAADRSQQERML